MKKIWISYDKWEDYNNGLFGTPQKSDEINSKIKELLTSIEFIKVGINTFREWANSSHHNMSDIKSNRKSYIGQAACCYKLGYSYKTTANAWQFMTKDEQERANKIADILITIYEQLYYDELLSSETPNENLS